MATPVERKPLSIPEYERMIDTGALNEDDHVELIEGELLRMAPLGLRHEASVRRLDLIFHRLLLGKVIVSIQNSIRIPPTSQPEPDVALLKLRDDLYEDSRPLPADVLLIVEVADSSLVDDRGRKRLLYANAGIPEYWLVNLQDDAIEIYSNPVNGVYQVVRELRRGDDLKLPGGFAGIVRVEDILGTKK